MNFYHHHTLEQLPRLLALMDKNPLSPTFGCFHRCYWLHRLSDFASSSRQMGVLSLAYAYSNDQENNLYYQNEQILRYIEGAMNFTCQLQNSDGSFDEWYPNERGWAGPTGYVISALATSIKLVEVDEHTMKKVKECIHKGAVFLADGWEKHVLANHVAMSLLAIYQAYEIDQEQKSLLDSYNKIFKKFESFHYQEEGWSLEYDGADPGYQSATISFLSRLYELNPDSRIKKICDESLEFISYFFYPDSHFSRHIGARETEVLFIYGVEYWAKKGNKLAQKMVNFSRDALLKKKMLGPENHEDHYFIYRLYEFFAASSLRNECDECDEVLPFEKSDFKKYFKSAGIYIRKKDDFYDVVNLARGGFVMRFECIARQCVDINSGWIGQHRTGKLYCSTQVGKHEIEIEGDKILIKGSASKVVTKRFNIISNIFFRLSCLTFAWNKKGAYWLKAFIRVLLFQFNKKSSIGFEREIFLGAKLVINDRIEGHEDFLRFCRSGFIDQRFVPQSRYFLVDDLEFMSSIS